VRVYTESAGVRYWFIAVKRYRQKFRPNGTTEGSLVWSEAEPLERCYRAAGFKALSAKSNR